jgi:7,8-dihydropterin-6-yl-methyl-4-(beta-D-ribofuranosyl)aminobenzene 5'-phosphate synthase
VSNENEPLSRDRREVVRVGGAAAFGAIAAWLTAGVSPVRAEALAQGAPVIDRLTVSVVIDSYQIAVAPDVKVGNVTIKRFGFALSDQPPGKAIASEFGLSLHAASQAGSETRNVLIDFGYTPEALNNNIGTAYNLKGRGLIVLSSCSHRGIVNIVKQAQTVSGVSKIHAIIGGFHLAPFKDDYVRDVVSAIKQIDPDYVVPMHCSGGPFYETMKAEMPTKLLRSFTGSQITFTS